MQNFGGNKTGREYKPNTFNYTPLEPINSRKIKKFRVKFEKDFIYSSFNILYNHCSLIISVSGFQRAEFLLQGAVLGI